MLDDIRRQNSAEVVLSKWQLLDGTNRNDWRPEAAVGNLGGVRRYLNAGDAKPSLAGLQQHFAMATADFKQVCIFGRDQTGERIDVQGTGGAFHFRSPPGRFAGGFAQEVAIAVNGR